MAEAQFVLDPAVVLKYHVEFYARFRDDIIVILGGDYVSRREFVDEFKRHSRLSKLKVEPVSAGSAVMLDLVLAKGKRHNECGILDVSMYAKPTAQGVPLSHLSCHQPSIHRSWPCSRVCTTEIVVTTFRSSGRLC